MGSKARMNVRVFRNEASHLEAFIRLNGRWIQEPFVLEAADRTLRLNPHRITDEGGHVFTAVEEQTVIGACALFKAGSAGCFPVGRDDHSSNNNFGPSQHRAGYAKAELDSVARVPYLRQTPRRISRAARVPRVSQIDVEQSGRAIR